MVIRQENHNRTAERPKAGRDKALVAKNRMHEHCQSLLCVVANPRMLARSIDDIGRKKILGDEGPAGLPGWYPWSWLRELQTRVLNGRFRSGKYQKFQHPKIGKEGFRTIEIPDTESRILARSLCNVLTPILDPDFNALSFGFRPGRSCMPMLMPMLTEADRRSSRQRSRPACTTSP